MSNELKLPEVIEQYYDYCIWIIPKISKFQKDQRYILGTAIENKSLEILNILIKAALLKDTKYKREEISEANIYLQQLRYYIRIAGDIRMLNKRSCGYAAGELTKIGAKIGLWYKSINENKKKNMSQ